MADNIRVRIESSNDPKGFADFDSRVDKSRREVEGFFNQLKRGVGIDLGGQIVRGIQSIPRAFRQAVSEGIDLNAAEARATRAIGAIIKQFDQAPTLDEAFKLSAGVVADLRKTSLDVASDFSTMLETLQLNAGNMFAGGVTDLKQMVDLTATLSESIKGVGLQDQRQAIQETRALLTGEIGPGATLARVVGIKKADIESAREAGNMYEFLTEKLKSFREAGAVAAQGFDGAMSNLNAQLDVMKKKLAEPLFQVITDAALELKKALEDGDLEAELGEIGEGLAEVVESGKDFALWVVENKESLELLVQVLVRFGAIAGAIKLTTLVAALTASAAAWVTKTAAVNANTAALVANAAAAGRAASAGKTSAAMSSYTIANQVPAALSGAAGGAALAAGGALGLRAVAGRMLAAIFPPAAVALIGNQIGKAIIASFGDGITGFVANIFVDDDAVQLASRIQNRVDEALADTSNIEGYEGALQVLLESIDEVKGALTNATGADVNLLTGSLGVLVAELEKLSENRPTVTIETQEAQKRTDAARQSIRELNTAIREIDDALVETLLISGNMDFEAVMDRLIGNARDRLRVALEDLAGLDLAIEVDTEDLIEAVRSTERTIEQRKELIPLLRNLVMLERELSDTREDAAQKSRDLAEATKERLAEGAKAVEQEIAAGAEQAAAVKERRRDFADELSVLQARAAGNDRLADQLEQARRVRLETLRIQRDLQVSEEEALRLAEAKVSAEQALRQEKSASRLGRDDVLDPISGAFNERFTALGAPVGTFPGLDRLRKMQEKPLRDSFRFPRLDALLGERSDTSADASAAALPQLRGTEVANKSGEALRDLRGTFERLTNALENADSDNAEVIGEIEKMAREALEKADRTMEQVRNSRD